jgi:hypothetical protein
MTKATYKPTLRPDTSLSDLERALSETLSLYRDMALNCRLALTLLYNYFGSIGEIKQDLGIWSQFNKMIETNDLVTELERIKAK